VPEILLIALPGLLSLVIPAAILAGHRHPAGPIVVSSGGACAAFAIFWLVLGGIYAFYGGASGNFLVGMLVVLAGVLLLLAAWSLALGAAAQARRYRWFALLSVAGSLSVAVVFISVSRPDLCLSGPPPTTNPYVLICPAPNPTAQLLVAVGYLAGPAAATAYSLRGRGARTGALPEGLSVSPLGAMTDADGESEVWTERL
jgi:hypothetical protein